MQVCSKYRTPLVSLQSGTNILLFAYGLVDLDSSRPELDITYHSTRRNTRIIPLRSYADPPADTKFGDLETFEFRLNNVSIADGDYL